MIRRYCIHNRSGHDPLPPRSPDGGRKMKIADTMHETRLSRNTVMLIDKETAQKIDTEALDTLCRLFQCDISDMLELTDEP